MSLVHLSQEVAEALATGQGVVALETTLVAHGFPGQEGVEVASESERQVRAAGAVPATVGVLGGRIVVGLDIDELSRFGGAADAPKVGARDLAACAVSGALGATTVGGTLAVCRQVGIRFMGTGGTGGVHRGFAQTLDISGDLAQIARCQVVVVASGPKSLLDVAATAEVLESMGVPVLGWRTSVMPRFYTSRGGPPVSARVESVSQVAHIAREHWLLEGGGLVVAQPPPRDLDVDTLMEEAVRVVTESNIYGQAVTPAVLTYIHEASGGATISLNKELIANNARLAGEVAVAFANPRTSNKESPSAS